jgi:general secretion pathway protein C
MTKSYFWVLHLLMIAVGAYFMADMVNLVVGSHLEAAIEVPQRGDGLPGKAVPVALTGTSDYRSIVEGNIFNSKMRGKQPEPEKFQEAAPEPTAPKVPLNMTLIGTAVGHGGASYAIIEDTKTKEQLLYRVGDLLVDEATIARITRNRVEIRHGKEMEVLEVSLNPEEAKAGAQPAPVSSAPVVPKGTPGSNVRQLSRNRWVLDRREVESAVDNLPQLLTKARIIPNFTEGKPDGFRIFAITEDSLYSKIGLQNGDILHRVNGIEVKDPQNFMKVFEQLKDETSITVDLVRNNQKETFGYEIR